MTRRVMTDIETLAVDRPDPVIVSIASCEFGVDGIGAEFSVSVDPGSCRRRGLVTDQDTLEWWQDRDPEARRQLDGGRPLPVALSQLSAFVEGADEFWAKPVAFDYVALESAYRAVDDDLEAPWPFYDRVDLWSAEKGDPNDWPEPRHQADRTEHVALDDCRRQAERVAGALRRQQAAADGGDR
jgi:hypothetical protein